MHRGTWIISRCNANMKSLNLFNCLRCAGTRSEAGYDLPLKKVDAAVGLELEDAQFQLSKCRSCADSDKVHHSTRLLGLRQESLHTTVKWFSTSSRWMKTLSPAEIKSRVDNLTDRFAEARELLGDARESLGSTYFSEDMTEAQEAVSATLEAYNALLGDLTEGQRNDVVRAIGLRMEELKAQEQAIKDLLD